MDALAFGLVFAVLFAAAALVTCFAEWSRR